MRFKVTVEIEVWQTDWAEGRQQPDEQVVVENMRLRAERYIAQETHATRLNLFWTGKGTSKVEKLE